MYLTKIFLYRLLQTLAARVIESLIHHYNQVKLEKVDLAGDIMQYNELFHDLESEEVKILYEKFKYIVNS